MLVELLPGVALVGYLLATSNGLVPSGASTRP